jgi:DNA-binding CsgD family transcriptional regulator
MARPQKTATLTEAQIEQMAAVGCTDTEIAILADISETDLKRSFGPLLKKGRSNLRDRIRTAQVRKALGHFYEKEDKDGVMQIYTTPPDNTMLIWLGKQYLGQSDKTETKDTSDPIDWDTIPEATRDAFIEGKISLDNVRRSTKRKRAGTG